MKIKRNTFFFLFSFLFLFLLFFLTNEKTSTKFWMRKICWIEIMMGRQTPTSCISWKIGSWMFVYLHSPTSSWMWAMRMGLLLSKLVPREGKKLILSYEAPAVKTLVLFYRGVVTCWEEKRSRLKKKKKGWIILVMNAKSVFTDKMTRKGIHKS